MKQSIPGLRGRVHPRLRRRSIECSESQRPCDRARFEGRRSPPSVQRASGTAIAEGPFGRPPFRPDGSSLALTDATMAAAPVENAPFRFPRIVDWPWRKATMELLTPRQVAVLAFGLLVAIGICDYFAGMEVAFTLLLYLLPVCLVTWRSGATVGLAFAALATASTALTALGFAERTRPSLVAWDAAGTFGVLITVVFVLEKLRAYVENERRQRRLAVDQLRHADRLNVIGTLAAGMAHELGTPLGVIAGRAKMIATADGMPSNIVQYGRSISAPRSIACRRSSADCSTSRGARRRRRRSANLLDLTKRILDLLGPIAAKRNVVLRVEKRGRTGVGSGRHRQVEQALVNLVSTDRRDGLARYRRRRRAQRPHGSPRRQHRARLVRVSVRDAGSGIKPEDLPHIFDPFFTTKDVGEGTGLGLSITYGIVQDHGGFLEVASRPHAGTRFSVLLPIPDPPAPTREA